MTSTNQTKIDLQRKDIHTLRNLARSIGVSKPTSKKKDRLIADILAIITGKEEPEFKNANRGRPAKTNNYVYPTGTISFSLAAASNEKPYAIKTQCSGVVVLTESGAKIKKLKFVDSASDVDISKDTVKKYKLKDNDIISYEIEDGKVKIERINDKLVSRKTIKVQDKTIVVGATNLLKVDASKQKVKIVEELDGKVIVIPASDIDKYQGKDIIILPVSALEDAEMINSFISGVSMASCYQKSGTTTTLVLSNYFNLVSSMQNVSEDVGGQIADYLKRFVLSGGTFVAFASSACPETNVLKLDNVD